MILITDEENQYNHNAKHFLSTTSLGIIDFLKIPITD